MMMSKPCIRWIAIALNLLLMGRAALCAIPAGDAGGLDLTPTPYAEEREGGKVQMVAFRSREGRVVYRPPADWVIHGSGNLAQLRTPPAGSEASIKAGPLPGSTTFTVEAVNALKKELLESLPRNSTEVEWKEDETDVVLFNRHHDYRITVAYSIAPQRFVTTMIVCNFEAQQVRFELTAREREFADLYETFRVSLFSWRGLK